MNDLLVIGAEVRTLDLGFENSDHNPVRLAIRKKDR